MQSAIERVMTTYGMLVHLTPEQEQEARERVGRFLQDKGTDEHMLAVEGLKYLRDCATKRRRVVAKSVQHCGE
jgi:YD repeat-containing protein